LVCFSIRKNYALNPGKSIRQGPSVRVPPRQSFIEGH
jgi:hypothetical protein